jgi:hypothetical protein
MSLEDEGGMIAQLTRVECGGSHTYNTYVGRGEMF